MTKITKKKDIIGVKKSDYVNKVTGEEMDSEIKNGRVFATKDTDMVIINSDEYVVMDSKVLRYIKDNFSTVDVGRILIMSDMANGEYNILYTEDNEPHTNKTLSEKLEYNRSRYISFMKRLEEKSIIYYIVGYTNGRKVKHIMLNPFLARKRKTFKIECISVFDNFNELI